MEGTMTIEAPNKERGSLDLIVRANGEPEPEPVEPGLGEIKKNRVGNLANGEARRIAEFLVKKDGEVTSTSFALVAYKDDEYQSHQAASSSLASLVEKEILKREKQGIFVGNTKGARDYGKERARAKKKVKKEEESAFKLGDVLEVVGFWKGHVVLRNMDRPSELQVVTDGTG